MSRPRRYRPWPWRRRLSRHWGEQSKTRSRFRHRRWRRWANRFSHRRRRRRCYPPRTRSISNHRLHRRGASMRKRTGKSDEPLLWLRLLLFGVRVLRIGPILPLRQSGAIELIHHYQTETLGSLSLSLSLLLGFSLQLPLAFSFRAFALFPWKAEIIKNKNENHYFICDIISMYLSRLYLRMRISLFLSLALKRVGLWKSRSKTWRIGLEALTTMTGTVGMGPAQFGPTSLFFNITVFFDIKGNKVFFFFSTILSSIWVCQEQ